MGSVCPGADGESEIWNPEIWDLDIGRILHLKAEIRNLKLDEPITRRRV